MAVVAMRAKCCGSARASCHAGGSVILDGTRGGPGWPSIGVSGQAPGLQPGPQASGIGESPRPGGHCQREQHTQIRCERGGHLQGPQPQRAQAQAQQQRHRHIAAAAREPSAASARCTTGSPIGGAHCAKEGACAVLNPLPGAAVPPLRWAKPRPVERAVATAWAAPGRVARGGLPRYAAVHPAMRTAIAPRSPPARIDRPLPGEVVIAPSRHGSAGTHLTHRRRDRFPRGFARSARGQPALRGPHSALIGLRARSEVRARHGREHLLLVIHPARRCRWSHWMGGT